MLNLPTVSVSLLLCPEAKPCTSQGALLLNSDVSECPSRVEQMMHRRWPIWHEAVVQFASNPTWKPNPNHCTIAQWPFLIRCRLQGDKPRTGVSLSRLLCSSHPTWINCFYWSTMRIFFTCCKSDQCTSLTNHCLTCHSFYTLLPESRKKEKKSWCCANKQQ